MLTTEFCRSIHKCKNNKELNKVLSRLSYDWKETKTKIPQLYNIIINKKRKLKYISNIKLIKKNNIHTSRAMEGQ